MDTLVKEYNQHMIYHEYCASYVSAPYIYAFPAYKPSHVILSGQSFLYQESINNIDV